jgi:hypothetical protein
MLILAGGGTLAWNSISNTLTWTSNFAIKHPFSGFLIEYVNGPSETSMDAVIYDGDILYGEFSSQITSNQLKNLKVSSVLQNNDNYFVLAWRHGNNLCFQNGVVL